MTADSQPQRRRGWGRGPQLHHLLAYFFAPLFPLARRIPFRHTGKRGHKPQDILLPEGYVAEVVATELNNPVHCTFDDAGACYVFECGYKIDALPRILKIDTKTGECEAIFQMSEEDWSATGAVTGGCWHEGSLYVANTNKIFRIAPDGAVEDVVTGLPWGDHQTNYPVVGPDGKLYFTNGTTTNTGVVGPDNWVYEWLRDHRELHDVPGADVTLVGRNFDAQDVVSGNLAKRVSTGAFLPFGTSSEPGQVIKGDVKCSGSVLRCNPDGSELELVAWGLRNPYGKAFSPDGRLFVTNHDIDERGHRFIVGHTEDFYEVTDGAWFGWPDFASGIRLDDPHWGRRGRGREPLLAEHPDPDPPKPFATFEPHSAPNGFDFCRDPDFGFEGDAFVAMFGDLAPNTTRQATPAGFKVARVDMQTGQVHDFAVNKIVGEASSLPHEGFERPSHCAFGPDGSLYVVDWGEWELAPERGGVRMQVGTGTLWRIRRTSGPRGDAPPKPAVIPLRGLMVYLPGALALGAAGGAAAWRLRRRRKRGRWPISS